MNIITKQIIISVVATLAAVAAATPGVAKYRSGSWNPKYAFASKLTCAEKWLDVANERLAEVEKPLAELQKALDAAQAAASSKADDVKLKAAVTDAQATIDAARTDAMKAAAKVVSDAAARVQMLKTPAEK